MDICLTTMASKKKIKSQKIKNAKKPAAKKADRVSKKKTKQDRRCKICNKKGVNVRTHPKHGE